jgi:hypothetical protein
MGHVELDHLKACPKGSSGSFHEGLEDALHPCFVQGFGYRVALVKGNGAWPHHPPAQGLSPFPGPGGPCLAPGVGQLDPRHRSSFPDPPGELLQARKVILRPDAQVIGADTAQRFHGGGLHQNEPHAPKGPRGVVEEVPVGYLSLQGGGVLAHGGHGQAVFQPEAAEFQGGEEQGHASIMEDS